jgi:hypothetical protein
MKLVPRFSIRMLLALTVLLGVAMATVGRDLHRASLQRASVKALEETGAAVTYGYERDGASAAGPAWVAESIGFDYFNTVTGVHFVMRLPLEEEEWKRLAQFRHLELLELRCLSMSDPELAPIAPFMQLKTVDLTGNQISDEGLAPLAGMRGLTTLRLDYNQIRGPGLRYVPGLKSLRMRCCQDVDLATIVKLEGSLEELSLEAATYSESQLGELARLAHLETLDLSGTNLSDAGLVHLAGLKNLKSLNISDTDVTNAGLGALVSLDRLESLEVHNTRVTDECRERLKGMPNLKRLAWMDPDK